MRSSDSPKRWPAPCCLFYFRLSWHFAGPISMFTKRRKAYMYFAALALFAATLAFVRRPTLTRYVILAALAGLAALVRPTLFVYGLASLFVAWLFTRRQGWQHARSSIGAWGLLRSRRIAVPHQYHQVWVWL